MKRSSISAALICLLGALTARADNNISEPARFQQKDFCISFWVDPPADDQMDDHYRRIAEAHFNVVMGGFGARTPEQIQRQLALCARYHLKAIVWLGDQPLDTLPDAPECLGYLLKDEPKAEQFDQLARTVRNIRTTRPGKLAYINLFPSHATPEHWGTDTYETYVSRFLDEVGVDVLCFDRYPLMNPGLDERDGYCENLEVIRRHASKARIPFWNFFKTMAYGRHEDPTESQILWQVYTSLAYGAKGILYFCYWTPQGQEFPRGGAIITRDGRPTRHYEHARRLNARLERLGPTLMQLSSTGVYRVKPGQNSREILTGTPIRQISDGDYFIGTFKHVDGRRAVLLNNYRFAYTAWPTVEFDASHADVQEVRPDTGRAESLSDDSPGINGTQISLDAGEGRLFLLPN